ncbi:unnamed protein product [Caenorhabditis auriculariae]|uniref:Uncharacterized protein n=1 Tax=Caenorhabditis auriculariae TaxID=2777116 RepID=A0A8S1HDS3_9PELO|nr:unnamed protein product [Caenorhabditis auriculariae]
MHRIMKGYRGGGNKSRLTCVVSTSASRMHDVEVDTRPYRREWRTPGEVRAPIGLREHSLHSDKPKYSRPIMRNTRDLGSSLASSSPMTSSEEGQPTDHWGANSSLSSSRGTEPPKRNTMSPPMYTSTPHQESPKLKSVGKTIEVKVERSEKVERTTEKTERNPQNQTYAQPILRFGQKNQPGYGSRSSVATSQMRCDQSEIDFSWVSEEEDKLRHEQRHQGERRLPECYFGMDPPSMEEKNEKENEKRRRLSVLEKTAALEQEVRRREANFLTRSTTQLGEPQPDYSPMHARESNPRDSGPSERRIYRIQRQSEGGRDEKRQRSSMAF